MIRARDPQDEKAWEDFTAYYQQFIRKLVFCMRIPPQDMEEVSQEVLIRLWKSLPSYDPAQGPFRPWMSTIIRRAVNTFWAKTLTHQKKTQIYLEDSALQPSAVVDSEMEFDALVEKEWRIYLTNLALERLRKVFSGKAIEAFTRFLDGEKVEQIAKELQLGVESVYTLRNRVKQRLVVEIQSLRQELEL